MPDETETEPPPPQIEALPFPATPRPDGRPTGCLRFGLVGCLGTAVLLIAGLLVVGHKAKSLLGDVLTRVGETIVLSTTPDVTPEDKKAFTDVYAPFVARARETRISTERISDFTTRARAALADGRITPDELRELTRVVKRDVE